MAILKLNSHEVLTQSGDNRPEFGAGVPSGTVLQVQYTQFTDIATMTSVSGNVNYVLCDGTAGSGTEILNVNITPKFNNSKMWIQVQWMGEFNPVSMTWNSVFYLWKNSTKLHNTSGAGNSGIMTPSTSYTSADESSTAENCTFQYFDISGTTNTITYKVGYQGNAGTIYTNRCVNPTTTIGSGYERGISSISVMEIAA